MKKLILPFFAFTLSIFNSCTSNNSINEEVAESVAQSYDVYIAGKENNKACYWKNNIKTDLTSGDNIMPLEIKVENNNVYVTGSNGITPTSFKSIHYFWKNGIKNEIRQYLGIPNSVQADITGFTVDNNDTYFAGYVENPATSNPLEKYELCYWKNGVKISLYKSPYLMSAEGIIVSGSDVYVSSLIVDNNQQVYRGYFKNTAFSPLSGANYVFNLTKNSAGVHILFKKNNKYYVKNISANTESLIGDYTFTLPFYGKITADASDNSLYTTYYNQGDKYFKNNTIISPAFSPLHYIQDLFVLDNNVYMIKYNDSNATYTGKVYINGVETQSITGSQNGTLNYPGTFNSLYVVKN